MGNRYERLAVDDIRLMLRLVHQLHSSTSDQTVRRRRLLEGLCDLTGAEAAESAVMDSPPAGVRVASSVRIATRGRSARALVTRGSATAVDPAVQRLVAAVLQQALGTATSRTRRELVGSTKAGKVAASLDRAQVDDTAYSAIRLAPADRVSLICLTRRSSPARTMGRRECQILTLLHSETAWVFDAPAPPSPATPGDLTPRQRECLRCLLAGRSEKQIADEMNVSPHTVHVHVKAVYRELAVSTRAELMSRFMGKGRASLATV